MDTGLRQCDGLVRFLTTEDAENTERMKNICNIIVSNFILIIVGLWVVFSLLYPEQIPTFTFTAITAGFAYQAYKYTKEKFRLELFEKRWEVYNKVIVFQSIFLKNRGLVVSLNQHNKDEIESAIEAAKNSFVDIGWHKSRCLFGREVIPFFQNLEIVYLRRQGETWNESSALAMYGDPSAQLEKNEDIEKIYESVRGVNQIFAPYLYFGDYKSNMENEKNLCDLCVLCGEKFKNLLSLKSRKD